MGIYEDFDGPGLCTDILENSHLAQLGCVAPKDHRSVPADVSQYCEKGFPSTLIGLIIAVEKTNATAATLLLLLLLFIQAECKDRGCFLGWTSTKGVS